METLRNILLALDPFIIWAFRLSDGPWAGFFLGSFFLNLTCVVMGDVTSILARRLNRKVYGAYHDEMVRHHNLSVKALRSSDKEAYKAVNRQAHEAFGKYFFSQAGAFALSIWPLPFALAWMELRFGGILHHRLIILQQPLRALQQPRTRLGGRQPPGRALHQSGAETLFQRGDGPGDRRRRTPQFAPGRRQAALLHHRHENRQLV